MRKYFYLILFAVCILPMTVFADANPNTTFADLKGEIYSNTSILNTYGGPSQETVFDVENPTRITGIWTYHWDVSDCTGATIKLVNVNTNVEYGPWPVETDSGSGRENVNWYVFPNVEIPAGRYKLVDSQNETWSVTSDTNNKGMAIVKGIQHLGDVTIDGSILKPTVGGTPKALALPSDANYEIKGVGWSTGTTVFEKGKYYRYSITIKPKDGYEFKDGDKVTITGVNWDYVNQYVTNDTPGCIYYESRIDVYDEYYDFLEGANLQSNDKNQFKFRIDADYNEFLKVYVDYSLIPSSQYTVKEGSTIIEFKPEFFDYLDVGEHHLKVEFTNGSARTKFTKLSNSVSEELNSNTSDNSVVNNPKTGDNIVYYLVIGLMSVFGLAGATIYTKRFN